MSIRTSSTTVESDEQYDTFEKVVLNQTIKITSQLFQTNASPESLWDAYLSGFPENRRQHYNCNSCRRFIQKYGGLVTINEQGQIDTPIWGGTVPEFFHEVNEALRSVVLKAKVNGVFLSSDKIWGTPQVGGWNHLSGISAQIYKNQVKTADQAMAEKLEDYKMLSHALADYSANTAEQALRILRADTLDRSEKTLGVAEWFAALHLVLAANPTRRNSLIWRAVASAPPGFAHIRSTMISTLLDDIYTGLEYESVAKRWADKMHPLRYQRPTAPPSSGTIEQAEKLVEKLGVGNSLKRRFARLEDVLSKSWVPSVEVKPKDSGGVFDHLKPSKQLAHEMQLPTVTMTWEKFKRTILGSVTSMEILLPHHGAFYGLVTAEDPDAPAIIQWDGLAGHPRNPVTWYFYHNGSNARDWNLTPGWAKVNAVFLSPNQWQDPSKFLHHATNVLFAIDQCIDEQPRHRGLALFPEFLKSEFHGIRSVIEAHSKKGEIIDAASGTANGLALSNSNKVTVRVKTSSGLASYHIDRLD